jgi:hypothetical protein
MSNTNTTNTNNELLIVIITTYNFIYRPFIRSICFWFLSSSMVWLLLLVVWFMVGVGGPPSFPFSFLLPSSPLLHAPCLVCDLIWLKGKFTNSDETEKCEGGVCRKSVNDQNHRQLTARQALGSGSSWWLWLACGLWLAFNFQACIREAFIMYVYDV